MITHDALSRAKRARELADNGGVANDGDRFRVEVCSGRTRKVFNVWRTAVGVVRCSCAEPVAHGRDGSSRCVHALAARYWALAVTAKSLRSCSVQMRPAHEFRTPLIPTDFSGPVSVETSNGKQLMLVQPAADIVDESETINQESTKMLDNLGAYGESQTGNVRDSQLQDWLFGNDAGSAAGTESEVDRTANGPALMLDRAAPGWSCSLRDIRQIGKLVVVTVALCIDGINREAAGTADAGLPDCVEAAERNGLRGAAEMFGFSQAIEPTSHALEIERNVPQRLHAYPVAHSYGTLVTPRQLGLIRMHARVAHLDFDSECRTLFQCTAEDLSRSAASVFIKHLETLAAQAQRDMLWAS